MEKPHPGGGGCRGSAAGDTPRLGWEFGIAETLETHRVGASLPPGLGSPMSPWHLAPLGCLSLGFSLSAPIFGLSVPQSPSSPKSSARTGPGLVGPKPSPVSWVQTALTPSPGGFWRQDEPGPPEGRWGCCPLIPVPECSMGGPEPPPALRMQPWQEVSGAAAARGPGRGQPAAAKLPAAFLRAMVLHRGLSPSTRAGGRGGGGRRDAPEPPPRATGTRVADRETEARGA